MADNDIVDELTVEHGKRTVVGKAFERIRLLFHVLVNFSTPEESAVKSGIQWLALKGEKDSLNKAKVCSFDVVVCQATRLAFSSLGFEIQGPQVMKKNFLVRIEERYWLP